LAFSAGTLAAVNPCGFAMLPAFVAFYVGAPEPGFEEQSLSRRGLSGLRVGLLVTLGFLVVFVLVGAAVAAGASLLVRALPMLSAIIGLGLIALGAWLLAGHELTIPTPATPRARPGRSAQAMFLFGVSYAIASLGCTLPIFLMVVATGLTAQNPMGSLAAFLAYAAGMGAVLMALALSVALFKGALALHLRRWLPHVQRLSGGLLVLAGLYLIYQQWSLLPWLG